MVPMDRREFFASSAALAGAAVLPDLSGLFAEVRGPGEVLSPAAKRRLLLDYLKTPERQAKLVGSLRAPLQLKRDYLIDDRGVAPAEADADAIQSVRNMLGCVKDHRAEVREVVEQIPWPEGHPGATFEQVFG